MSPGATPRLALIVLFCFRRAASAYGDAKLSLGFTAWILLVVWAAGSECVRVAAVALLASCEAITLLAFYDRCIMYCIALWATRWWFASPLLAVGDLPRLVVAPAPAASCIRFMPNGYCFYDMRKPGYCSAGLWFSMWMTSLPGTGPLPPGIGSLRFLSRFCGFVWARLLAPKATPKAFSQDV